MPINRVLRSTITLLGALAAAAMVVSGLDFWAGLIWPGESGDVVTLLPDAIEVLFVALAGITALGTDVEPPRATKQH